MHADSYKDLCCPSFWLHVHLSMYLQHSWCTKLGYRRKQLFFCCLKRQRRNRSVSGYYCRCESQFLCYMFVLLHNCRLFFQLYIKCLVTSAGTTKTSSVDFSSGNKYENALAFKKEFLKFSAPHLKRPPKKNPDRPSCKNMVKKYCELASLKQNCLAELDILSHITSLRLRIKFIACLCSFHFPARTFSSVIFFTSPKCCKFH